MSDTEDTFHDVNDEEEDVDADQFHDLLEHVIGDENAERREHGQPPLSSRQSSALKSILTTLPPEILHMILAHEATSGALRLTSKDVAQIALDTYPGLFVAAVAAGTAMVQQWGARTYLASTAPWFVRLNKVCNWDYRQGARFEVEWFLERLPVKHAPLIDAASLTKLGRVAASHPLTAHLFQTMVVEKNGWTSYMGSNIVFVSPTDKLSYVSLLLTIVRAHDLVIEEAPPTGKFMTLLLQCMVAAHGTANTLFWVAFLSNGRTAGSILNQYATMLALHLLDPTWPIVTDGMDARVPMNAEFAQDVLLQEFWWLRTSDGVDPVDMNTFSAIIMRARYGQRPPYPALIAFLLKTPQALARAMQTAMQTEVMYQRHRHEIARLAELPLTAAQEQLAYIPLATFYNLSDLSVDVVCALLTAISDNAKRFNVNPVPAQLNRPAAYNVRVRTAVVMQEPGWSELFNQWLDLAPRLYDGPPIQITGFSYATLAGIFPAGTSSDAIIRAFASIRYRLTDLDILLLVNRPNPVRPIIDRDAVPSNAHYATVYAYAMHVLRTSEALFSIDPQWTGRLDNLRRLCDELKREAKRV